MKKLLLLILLIFPILTFSQDNSWKQENEIAKEVFETFSVDYLKSSFVEILKLDDDALSKAQKKYPNPADWEKQIDYVRELEDNGRLNWYSKQKWWEEINMNKSIAGKIRMNIAEYGIVNGWYD
jgi:hypothetical protein